MRRPKTATALPLIAAVLVSLAPAPFARSATTTAVPGSTQTPSATDLSQQLANPLANLISVPLQSNFDYGSGTDEEGFRYTLNVQPVVPFELNEDWNLITRTILPVIYQNDKVSPLSDSDDLGLGDTVASFFLSPSSGGAVTWGVGPVVYLPTATENVLGADQWGLGPTGVLVVAEGPWTYGGLANHIWSFGKTRDFDDFFANRPQINATLLQPFVSYSFGKGWSSSLSLDASYDWEGDEWTAPAILTASKVFTLAGQTVSAGLGPKYYLSTPDNGPDWGIRLIVSLVFPK